MAICSPAILTVPAVSSVTFNVDKPLMFLSKPPLAVAMDHIVPHRSFTQVTRMFTININRSNMSCISSCYFFCLISRSPLLLSESYHSDRMWCRFSCCLLGCFFWCLILHSDCDRPQWVLRELFLTKSHMLFLRPAVCHYLHRQSSIPGQPMP